MKTLRFIGDLCIAAICLLLISPWIMLGLVGLLLSPAKVKSNQPKDSQDPNSYRA